MATARFRRVRFTGCGALRGSAGDLERSLGAVRAVARRSGRGRASRGGADGFPRGGGGRYHAASGPPEPEPRAEVGSRAASSTP